MFLFQVLTEREEKASAAIATNESFSGWTKTFTDPRLCAAIVDRLTFKGTIIENQHRLLPPRPHQKPPTCRCLKARLALPERLWALPDKEGRFLPLAAKSTGSPSVSARNRDRPFGLLLY